MFSQSSIYHQGVIQEFAVEAVKHELGISNNRAEGFGGQYMSKVFPYMTSKCSENAFKWTGKPTIFTI